MLTEPNRKPLSSARNPLLYTSLLVLLSMLYAGWVLFSRRQEVREIEEKAKAEKLAQDKKIVYSRSKAQAVAPGPQTNSRWPSFMRCVDVAPKKDTTYTLTAKDGQGNSK